MYAVALLEIIQNNLSEGLRAPRYRGNPNPLAGHCYVASEALYHMIDREAHEVRPMQATVDGESHWWLVVDGVVLDPTAGQFVDPERFYARGKGKGFLTREPSHRAAILIDRVECDLILRAAEELT